MNIILLTDGDEWCDPSAGSLNPNPAAAAAATLWNGVTVGGKVWKIPTYVINFAGGTQASTDTIAAAGGTTSSLFATNEAQLSAALANIVAGAIKPEVCDNTDNNCNGCVDEGYKHWCHRNKTAAANPTNDSQCCNWTTAAQRTTCINNYLASVTQNNPQGDRYKLPCYTPANLNAALDSAQWLCYDPGDRCDGLDNNCEGATPNASQVDENTLRCGDPLHCPVAETCNGQDDDCDGIIDNAAGNSNPYSIPGCTQCVPSAELCDGCDNDCDGVADDGIAPISCGVPDPANCGGTISCGAPVNVSTPGGCIQGAPTNRWGTCSNNPQPEVCDGKDNDCDGIIDDGLPSSPCTIPGQPGLVYQDTNPNSQCVKGTQPCNGECTGWVGPTTEICDGKDNDCDGQVDEGLTLGQACDGVCGKGTTACIGGALVCQTTVQPQPEVCDGIDNDCNGIVDDGTLADAPNAANKPCWDEPVGSCSTPCSFTGSSGTVSWCAPSGASCHGIGSLTSPCQLGQLQCQAGGWKCVGALGPDPEVCDGNDNNCDGQVDNGLAATPCGSDEGECQMGTQQCVGGQIECQGEIGPVPEVCDGKDNDCDGVVDNGISIGTACWPAYDTSQYPGPRDKGQCKPGVSECDSSGQVVCNGGVGPSPEVCDGLDNDCDGQVDEPGDAPDGINGTANPQNPAQVIGQACGESTGACEPGKWTCVTGGAFQCVGGVLPRPEVCNCLDDDCDGQVDEDPEPGSGDPALCSTDKVCVSYQDGCQCAGQCKPGEFPCPTGGFSCEWVNRSGTEQSAGQRCVIDGCGDCGSKTVTGAQGEIVCAPAGTVTDAGRNPPVCVCKENSCHAPCYGVSCTSPQVCTDYGPNAGKCVEDNCWNVPCGPEQVCNQGGCMSDPCVGANCQPDEVCKPASDFTSYECTKSCAGVDCEPGYRCTEGVCVETGCAQDCEPGTVCAGQDAGGCVPSVCTPETCPNGAWCNPLTGACGNYPCEGVHCPSGQHCEEGECVGGAAPDGGTGGTAGAGGAGGAGGTAGTGGAGGGATDGSAGSPAAQGQPRGNWGLATGGGGCACKAGAGSGNTRAAGVLAVLALLAMGPRMRRRRRESAETANADSRMLEMDGGQR